MLTSTECVKALEILEEAGIHAYLTYDLQTATWTFDCFGEPHAEEQPSEGEALFNGLLHVVMEQGKIIERAKKEAAVPPF